MKETVRHLAPIVIGMVVIAAFVTAVESSPTWAGAILVVAAIVLLIKYSTPK